MKFRIVKLVSVVFMVSLTSQAFSKEASVKIIFPSDGATLMSTAKNKIDFEAIPGPKGDHVHLSIDDKAPIVLRQLKGNHTLENLEAGNRNICIKLVDKNHTPVGTEKCIKVKVE